MTTSTTDRIEKQIDLNAPVSRVWNALTDHKEFGAWFCVDLESPFVPGQTTRGRITHSACSGLVMEIEIVEMTAERVFSYRWHPYAVDPNIDYTKEPPTLVEFRLEPTAEGTRLFLTESGFDAIPPERRDEAFRMNEGGWTAQLKNITTYVAQHP